MWKGYLSGLEDWSKPCPEECSVADDEGNWSKGKSGVVSVFNAKGYHGKHFAKNVHYGQSL